MVTIRIAYQYVVKYTLLMLVALLHRFFQLNNILKLTAAVFAIQLIPNSLHV